MRFFVYLGLWHCQRALQEPSLARTKRSLEILVKYILVIALISISAIYFSDMQHHEHMDSCLEQVREREDGEVNGHAFKVCERLSGTRTILFHYGMFQ